MKYQATSPIHEPKLLRRELLQAASLFAASALIPALGAAESGGAPVKPSPFVLPPLPYAKDALVPHLSIESMEYHYGKHHQAYVTNLNKLVDGKPEAGKTLENLIVTSDGSIFNTAAQLWNHTFFWNSMKPSGGGEPTGPLRTAIERDFGSFAQFAAKFAAAATAQFGSGWAWLVSEGGKLQVIATANADLPLKHGQKALLTIDVWEHAYYIDYRNARAKWIDTYLSKLVNWEFAQANYIS